MLWETFKTRVTDISHNLEPKRPTPSQSLVAGVIMVAGAKISVTNKRRLLWGKVLQWIILGFAVLTMAQFAMAITLFIAVFKIRSWIRGHSPAALPTVLLINGLLTIGLCALGYRALWYVRTLDLDARYKSIKKLMQFQIMGGVLALINLCLAITCFAIVTSRIKSDLRKGLKDAMQGYSEGRTKTSLDLFQIEYKCCGIDSFADWFAVPWQVVTPEEAGVAEDSAPWSCCDPSSSRACIHFQVTSDKKSYSYPADITLYDQGCLESITDYLGKNAFYVCGYILLIITLFLVILVIWVRVLETSLTNAYAGGDPERAAWGYLFKNHGPSPQGEIVENVEDQHYAQVSAAKDKHYDQGRQDDKAPNDPGYNYDGAPPQQDYNEPEDYDDNVNPWGSDFTDSQEDQGEKGNRDQTDYDYNQMPKKASPKPSYDRPSYMIQQSRPSYLADISSKIFYNVKGHRVPVENSSSYMPTQVPSQPSYDLPPFPGQVEDQTNYVPTKQIQNPSAATKESTYVLLKRATSPGTQDNITTNALPWKITEYESESEEICPSDMPAAPPLPVELNYGIPPPPRFAD